MLVVGRDEESSKARRRRVEIEEVKSSRVVRFV